VEVRKAEHARQMIMVRRRLPRFARTTIQDRLSLLFGAVNQHFTFRLNSAISVPRNRGLS